MNSEFFTLHQAMDRQGPGSAEDVAWVADLVGLRPDARVCDAACGPGADVEHFLELVPEGHVTAVDSHGIFIDELLGRIGVEPRLTAYKGDMRKLKGPYDLIWSQGAVYFVGIEAALTAWRPVLAPGGTVAFSEPAMFTDAPSEAALAYWEGYVARSAAEIAAAVDLADFETVATRRLPDASWAVYHRTMQARIDALRPKARGALLEALDDAQQEIDAWQQVKHETGYLLSVVRPR